MTIVQMNKTLPMMEVMAVGLTMAGIVDKLKVVELLLIGEGTLEWLGELLLL